MSQQSCAREQQDEETAITLFWSRRGEIACAAHAPDPDSPEWAARAWCVIPPFAAAARHGLMYQCPSCSGDRRSYRRASPANRPAPTPISHWSPGPALRDASAPEAMLDDMVAAGRFVPGLGWTVRRSNSA